jgi:hypothetical protein
MRIPRFEQKFSCGKHAFAKSALRTGLRDWPGNWMIGGKSERAPIAGWRL